MNEQTPHQHHRKVDQAEIDWFVEGEMSASEKDDLFRQLDADPTGWKRCALTLLETRALRKTIGQLRADNDPFAVPTTNAVGLSETINLPGPEQTLGVDQFHPPATKENGIWTNAGLMRWTVAASLLLALGFGFGVTWKPARTPVEATENAAREKLMPQDLAERDPEAWRQVSNAINSIGQPDAEILALVGMQRGHTRLVLPVIQSAKLQQQIMAMPEPTIPHAIDQRLRDKGWRVNHWRQFLSVSLPNGRRDILPIDLLDYHYVGQPQL